MAHAGGRPPIFEKAEQLQSAIDDYFNPEVIEEIHTNAGIIKTPKGRQPRRDSTITGLAYHLGFESRQSFYDYENREEFSYTIKRARLRIENEYEMKLSANNVAGAIFALKNLGWKDKTEQDINVQGSITWNEQKTYEQPK